MESPETFTGLIAWSILTGALCFVALTGLVLSYHWFQYAMSRSAAVIALAAYSGVCVLLLTLLLSAVIQIV